MVARSRMRSMSLKRWQQGIMCTFKVSIGSGADARNRSKTNTLTLKRVPAEFRSKKMPLKFAMAVEIFQTTATLCGIEKPAHRLNAAMYSKHMSSTSAFRREFPLAKHAAKELRRKGCSVTWRSRDQSFVIMKFGQYVSMKQLDIMKVVSLRGCMCSGSE